MASWSKSRIVGVTVAVVVVSALAVGVGLRVSQEMRKR
jgi:putative Ca2+/H+ antiporter (TMEM165/GDT1 family)